MRYPLTILENPKNLGQVLFEFNGATMISLRYFVLPIQVDPITLNVRFSMVEDLSPYNIILGRSWMHKMKAILFTYHQMVSYLMEARQVDLHGS